MLKKLTAKRGFTLTELLATIVILSFVGIAVAAGISSGGRAMHGIASSSEAAVLCSTLVGELSDELRFAQDISGDGASFTFCSSRYGSDISVAGSGGRITLGGADILSDKAYMGLLATAHVTYTGGVFDVIVTVTDAVGTTLHEQHFSVAPLSES